MAADRDALCAVVVVRCGPPCSTDSLAGRQVFPAGNWWNLDITRRAGGRSIRLRSSISSAGARPRTRTPVRQLHPDFGPPPYGFPYVVVSGDQPRVSVGVRRVRQRERCRSAGLPGYPIPDEARTQPNYIEGGVTGGGSRAIVTCSMIDRDRWLLYETFATRWNAIGAAVGGGFRRRVRSDHGTIDGQNGWTSADAAGLAIFPGLIRYDEVFGAAEITHAFRVTTRATQRIRVAGVARAGINPQRAADGCAAAAEGVKDISGIHSGGAAHLPRDEALRPDRRRQRIRTCTSAGRWMRGGTTAVLNPAFSALTADDFEVVQLGWQAQQGADAPHGTGEDIRRPFRRGRVAAKLPAFRYGRVRPWCRISFVEHGLEEQARRRRGERGGRGRPFLTVHQAPLRPTASRSPRPTAASTPTIRRTIFQRKCDALDRGPAPARPPRRSSTESTEDVASTSRRDRRR